MPCFIEEAQVDTNLQFAVLASFKLYRHARVHVLSLKNPLISAVDRRQLAGAVERSIGHSLTILIKHHQVGHALQFLRAAQCFADVSVITLRHGRRQRGLKQAAGFRAAQFKLTDQVFFGQSLTIPQDG